MIIENEHNEIKISTHTKKKLNKITKMPEKFIKNRFSCLIQQVLRKNISFSNNILHFL